MSESAAQCDFAILGAGAIGSILGAHLARAGCSVIMIARGRRAHQVRHDGLRVTGLAEIDISVGVIEDVRQLHSAKVLIVSMKTPGTAEALASLRHVDIEVAFSLQNGVLKDELLADNFGRQRVLGALADTSGEMANDGRVLFTRNVNVLLGELAPDERSRARVVAERIDASGVRARAVDNIIRLEWSKFAGWIGLFVLSISTRTVTWRYLTDPDSALVLVKLVREVGTLARALGIELTDDAVIPVATVCAESERGAVNEVVKVGERWQSNAPNHRMSSLQDFEAGRSLEIHETLGHLLRKAEQSGVSLPLVDGFYHAIAAAERLRTPPAR